MKKKISAAMLSACARILGSLGGKAGSRETKAQGARRKRQSHARRAPRTRAEGWFGERAGKKKEESTFKGLRSGLRFVAASGLPMKSE